MKGFLAGFAFGGRAKARKVQKKTDLKQMRGKGWLFAYSPEARSFIAKNRKVLRSVYEFIRNEENIKRLRNSALRLDIGNGIHIGYGATGLRYKGHKTTSTLKVSVAGKEFFVKIGYNNRENVTTLHQGMQFMENYLRKRHYKIEEFNVRTIKPLLMYEPPEGKTYIVTEFYREGDVISVYDMERYNFTDYNGPKSILKSREDPRFQRLNNAIRSIREDTGNKIGDLDIHNAFYEPKTNTILLFDLRRRQRYGK